MKKIMLLLIFCWLTGVIFNLEKVLQEAAPFISFLSMDKSSQLWQKIHIAFASIGLQSPLKTFALLCILVSGGLAGDCIIQKKYPDQPLFKRNFIMMFFLFSILITITLNLTNISGGMLVRRENNQLEALHRADKYEDRFGPFLKQRPLLSGQEVLRAPSDVLDSRFLLLSRMKERIIDENFSCSPKGIERIKERYEIYEFPADDDLYPPANYGTGDRKTCLVLTDRKEKHENYILFSTPKSYYLLPDYIYGEMCP